MFSLPVFAASSLQRLRKTTLAPLPKIKSAGRALPLLGLLALTSGVARPVHAQTYLLQDEFSNTSNLWDVHDNTWFLQRTRFGNAPQILTSGGTSFARFNLNTYNSAYAGTATRGTEIWSKNPIPLGGGVEFEARIRATNLPRGAVMSFYTYRERPAGDNGQQEIDFEILGNHPVNRYWLNIWTSTTRNSQSAPSVSGADRTNWTTYKIRWNRGRVDWYVNNTLARTETTVVPADPMKLCFNIWAANSSWTDAYDSSLRIASSSPGSTYYFDVDYVRVTSLGAAPADTTNPTVNVAAPGNNFSYRTLAQAGGTATDTGGSNLASVRVLLQRDSDGLFWNGSTWGQSTELTPTGTLNWTYNLPSLADGKYNFSAIARDGAGNSTTDTNSFYIDNQAPVVTITAPTAATNTPLAQATGTAIDAGGGTAQVRVALRRANGDYWNGTAWTSTATQLTPIGINEWTLNLPTLAVGTYTIGATATDYIGNASPATSVTFTVAPPAAPTIAITAPGEAFSYKTLPAVTGTAAGTNLTNVRVILQRASDNLYWTGSTWGASTELAATGTANWTYTPPALADGRYIVRAIIRDGQGESTTSTPVSFYIDNAGPVVQIIAPTAATTTPIAQATGTATDAGGGTAEVRATLRRANGDYWNGTAWTTTEFQLTPAGIDEWTLNLPTLAAGAYTFSVSAEDYIGNSAAPATVNFTVAPPAAPTIAITAPGDAFSYKTLAQVTGTATGTNLTNVRVILQRDSDKLFWTGSAWGASTELAATGTANWTYSLPTLADNKYIVSAIIRDAQGAATTSTAVDFFIDNVGPVVRITAPTAATSTSIPQATGTAIDAGGGTAQVRATLRRANGDYWNGTAWAAAVAQLTPIGIVDWTLNLPNLPTGTYTLAVTATDYIGNTTPATLVTFTVAPPAAPTIEIEAPGEAFSYKTLAQVTGTATGTNLTNVRVILQRDSDKLYWTGSAWGVSTELAATGTSTWTYNLPTLADGKYIVRAIIRDAQANAITSTPVSFFIDSIAPVVRITAPTAATNTSIPQATGTAIDAGGGTAQVRATLRRANGDYWNGTGWAAAATQLTPIGINNWTLNLPNLPAGAYTLAVTATDFVGNASAATSVTFTVAPPSAPTIEIEAPGEAFSYKTLAQVTGTATGTNLTNVRVILQRDSDKLFWTGTTWGASTELAATGTSTWTYNLPTLADGKYIVRAIIRDAQGASTTSTAVNFYIDNQAPVVTIITPTASTTTSIPQATGTAIDAGGGTAQVRATLRHSGGNYWNGTTWTPTATELTPVGIDEWALNLPSLPGGQYTISVTAQDYIGNKSAAKSVTFNVAVPGPAVFITTPDTGSGYSTLAQVTGTATGVNLAAVRLLLQRDSDKLFWNGTAWGASTELAVTGISNWSYQLPTLAAGKYTVTAIVRDDAGVTNTSIPVIFSIDNLGPNVSVTTPANGLVIR